MRGEVEASHSISLYPESVLERDFGIEGAELSEREFRHWVGRDLVDWVRRDFFRRHVQQFKQRPIAWHLVSPERNFEAFVLYHNLSRATLQKLRAQYAGRADRSPPGASRNVLGIAVRPSM